MRFNQLKWFHLVGFVLAVVLVVGGGFWWINRGEGSKGGVSVNKMEVVEDERILDEERNDEEESGAEIVSEGEIDTSDWKTYPSDYYGFSFRYPNSVEIQDTLGDLYIIEKETRIKMIGISKPLLKNDIAEGYPEKSLPILNKEIRDQMQVNNLDIKIFSGTELSGKGRNFAIVRSKNYLTEIMTFGNIDVDNEGKIFKGIIQTIDFHKD